MARRMRHVAAIALLAVVTLAAGAAEARVRLAVADFEVSGGDSPALTLQLQDGFVQGLVRAGIQVFDTVDTTKKLEGHPELQHCDTSACLKAIGQQLDVRYVVRVRVEVAGNSYKSVARVFSTEGSAPASLPIATKSKTCDVCTVVEARESLVRLADMMRPQIEEPAAAAAQAIPATPTPKPPSITIPIVAAMAGAVSVAVGFAILASNGSCTGTSCSENRTRSALGGGLIGAGAAVAVMGAYVTVVRTRGGEPVTGVAMTVPF
jgi:TolB-like protein